jgi:protein-tyrosine phosphatase
MTKILMVCLGNICRSPLAEGILQKKLADAGLSKIVVDSAGTINNHVGQHPDQRSILNAKKHGVDISRHTGRQLMESDFSNFQKIYVMDSSNYSDAMKLAKTSEEREKVQMILNELEPGKNASVPDPYFGGEQGFELVFQLLDKACAVITEKLVALQQEGF